MILEQEQQGSLSRLLVLDSPQEAQQARQARRAALRAQRKTMENTGTFADELSQFREQGGGGRGGAASAPASQPAEPTPREKVYKAAAKQIGAAIESQREACAYLLDGEIKPAHEKQSAASEQMYAALYLFPLEPGQVLVKARQEQAALRELVNAIKADEDWLRDPLMANATVPKDTPWDAKTAPVHVRQSRVGTVLALLHRQCQHVAATSQPVEQAKGPPQPPEPMLDPELNRKLADVLAGAPPLSEKALAGIAARDGTATLPVQDDLLKLIDSALDLLPKTIEQRITELILRQGRLNGEVRAEAGEPGTAATNAATTALEDIRKWATRLKSRLLGNKPAKLAETMSATQKTIRTDTTEVNDEVKQKIPAGAASQPSPAPAASQPAELKTYIEASKHLVEAGTHMDAARAGFDQAVVEDSLRSMQPGGPVQVLAGQGAGGTGQGPGGPEAAGQPAQPGPGPEAAEAGPGTGPGQPAGSAPGSGPDGEGTRAGRTGTLPAAATDGHQGLVTERESGHMAAGHRQCCPCPKWRSAPPGTTVRRWGHRRHWQASCQWHPTERIMPSNREWIVLVMLMATWMLRGAGGGRCRRHDGRASSRTRSTWARRHCWWSKWPTCRATTGRWWRRWTACRSRSTAA